MELRFFEDIDFVKDIETLEMLIGDLISREMQLLVILVLVEITTSTDFPRKCYYQVILYLR